MALGDRVKQRREEKQWSAAELARRADVSKAYLSELESGKTSSRPSADVLLRVASVLGTTVADLLEREVPRPEPTISSSLQQFAEGAHLPGEDVKMLSQIRFRGEQPATVEDWRFLYESIRRSITKGG